MFWFFVGIIVLLWAVYDLAKGTVWSYRHIDRRTEPGMFWFVWMIWMIVGLSCTMPYVYYYM